MTAIKINVQEPYYSYILKGEKTVEGRLNKGKFASLRAGDILAVGPNEICFKVIYKKIYKSFREMIKKEGIKNVIPDKKTIKEATEVYYKFFTPEEEKTFKVLAIKIRKMKKEEK